MTRRVRLAAAILALAATLFAPLAMALHACLGDSAAQAAAEALALAQTHAMHGGNAMPMDMPVETDMALCVRHCNEGKYSLQAFASPPDAVAMPVVPALRVDALQPAALRAPAFDSPFAPAAGPAPPLIGFTVLRI